MNSALARRPAFNSEKTTKPKSSDQPWRSPLGQGLTELWRRKATTIAALSVAAITVHLVLRFGFKTAPGAFQIPLLATLALGGIPLLYDLFRKLLRREFGSDLLGGISIVTSVMLGQYLAGSIIVLMLAGGEALESVA
jgi:cation transport ATPase